MTAAVAPTPTTPVGGSLSTSAAVRLALERLALPGLPVPSETFLFGAGAALFLQWDTTGATPILRGLHPNRLLRLLFGVDVWGFRSRLVSDNALDLLAERAARDEWTLVELDREVLAGRSPEQPDDPADTAALVVGRDPAGAWWEVRDPREPAPLRVAPERLVAALYRPVGGFPRAAHLFEHPVARLRYEPSLALRLGLERWVQAMAGSVPAWGVTGLAAFGAVRAACERGELAGLVRGLGRAALDGGAAFYRDTQAEFLRLAAEEWPSGRLEEAASALATAAELWRKLSADAAAGRLDAGAAVERLATLERLERASLARTREFLGRAPAQVSVPRPEPRLADYRHVRGVHCGTMALRNVATHATGGKWTESLCFGLAAGLNFTYLRPPGSPFFLTMGRGSYMEETFCDTLGIRLEIFHSDDPRAAEAHLASVVGAGRLAVVDTDMFYLPYMVQALRLMDGVHFGGHKLLVTGWDAASASYTVWDYAWAEAQVLPAAVLARARDSRECPEPPRNACFTFGFPDQLVPLTEALPLALRTFVSQMRHPFLNLNGLPAIERFCRQAARWGRILKGEELRLNTELTAFMFEKAGTGGGNFRNLYQRFLREAARELDWPELLPVADRYRRLAEAWREVAELLDAAVLDPTAGLYAPDPGPQRLLDEIAVHETQGVAEIDAILRAHGHGRPPTEDRE
ncbi:MAG: DUF4872 domain-containing protein [Thermoanaerobaculia bacterium]|nr:DUF4872 domain-containing protein [Thermoanaerobaculia bacterium]